MANGLHKKKKEKKVKAKQRADKLAAFLKLVSTELEDKSPDQSLGELLEITRHVNNILIASLAGLVKDLAARLGVDAGKLILDFLFEAINVRLSRASELDHSDAAGYDLLSRASIELSSLLNLCQETLAAMKSGSAAGVVAINDACRIHQATIQVYLAESEAVKADVAAHKRTFRAEAAVVKVDDAISHELSERFKQIEIIFGLLLSSSKQYSGMSSIFQFLKKADFASDADIPKKIDKYTRYVGYVVDFSKYAFTTGRTRLLGQDKVSADEVCRECLVECRAVRDKLQQLIAGEFAGGPEVVFLQSSMEMVDDAIENLPTMCQVDRAKCYAYISYFSLCETPPAQALACGLRYLTKECLYQYGITELPHADKLFYLKELVPLYVYQANLPEGAESADIKFSIAYLKSVAAANAEWPIVVLLKCGDCWGIEATLPVSRAKVEEFLVGREPGDAGGIVFHCQLSWPQGAAAPVAEDVALPPAEVPVLASLQNCSFIAKSFDLVKDFFDKLSDQDFREISKIFAVIKARFGISDDVKEVKSSQYFAYINIVVKFMQYTLSYVAVSPELDHLALTLKADCLGELAAISAQIKADRALSEKAEELGDEAFYLAFKALPERIDELGRVKAQRYQGYIVLPMLKELLPYQRLVHGAIFDESDGEVVQYGPNLSVDQLDCDDQFAVWTSFSPVYKCPAAIKPGAQTMVLKFSANFLEKMRAIKPAEQPFFVAFDRLCQYQAIPEPSWLTKKLDGASRDGFVSIKCSIVPIYSHESCKHVLDRLELLLRPDDIWMVFNKEVRKDVEGLNDLLATLFAGPHLLEYSVQHARLMKRYEQVCRNTEFDQGVKLLNVFNAGQADYYAAVQKITAYFSQAEVAKKPKSRVADWAIKKLRALALQHLEKHPAAAIELAKVIFDLYKKFRNFTGMNMFRVDLEKACDRLVENKDQQKLSKLISLYIPLINDGLLVIEVRKLEQLSAEVSAVTAELKEVIRKTLLTEAVVAAGEREEQVVARRNILKTLADEAVVAAGKREGQIKTRYAHRVYDRVMEVLRAPPCVAEQLVSRSINVAMGQAALLDVIWKECFAAEAEAHEAEVKADVTIFVRHAAICELLNELVSDLPLEQADAASIAFDPRDVESTESLPSGSESDGSEASAAEIQHLRQANAAQAARIAQLEAMNSRYQDALTDRDQENRHLQGMVERLLQENEALRAPRTTAVPLVYTVGGIRPPVFFYQNQPRGPARPGYPNMYHPTYQGYP